MSNIIQEKIVIPIQKDKYLLYLDKWNLITFITTLPIFGVGLLLLIFYFFFGIRLKHEYLQSLTYSYDDQFLYADFSNACMTQRKAIPFSRITDICIVQDWIQRKYGIYSLYIQTPSQGANSMPELKIEGIENPDEIRALLLEKIKKTSS